MQQVERTRTGNGNRPPFPSSMTPTMGVSPVVVPAKEAHNAVCDALRRRRFEVIRLPYEAVYRVGGSFRCAHQPLIRT